MNPALTVVGDQRWQRSGESMDRVEWRLRKAVNILESTSIPFAIVGGNAVRVWVAQVDPGAVRATNDVDILIRPEDLEQLKLVKAANGYHYRKAAGLDSFSKEKTIRYAMQFVFFWRIVWSSKATSSRTRMSNQLNTGTVFESCHWSGLFE